MVQELTCIDTGDAIAHSCCFDKTSKLCAVGLSNGEIKFVNIEKNEITQTLKGSEDAVNAIVIN